MKPIIKEFCNTLNLLKENDELIIKLYDVVDLIENEHDISDAFESIFKFFEKHVNSDIGSPGPLVHLIEKFYPKYINNLILSLKRNPTFTTIHLLNRILNSKLEQNTRTEYIKILELIANSKTIDLEISNEAKQYYEHQNS